MVDGRSYSKIHTNSNSKPISSLLLTRKQRVQSEVRALMANALHDQSLHGKELLLKTSPTPPPHPKHIHHIHVGTGVIFTNIYTPLALGIFALHSMLDNVYCHLYLACMYIMYPQLPVKKEAVVYTFF